MEDALLYAQDLPSAGSASHPSIRRHSGDLILCRVPVDRAPRDRMAGWQGRGTRILSIGRADRSGVLPEQELRPSLREASADAKLLRRLAQGRAALIKQRGQASVLILGPGKGAWHR